MSSYNTLRKHIFQYSLNKSSEIVWICLQTLSKNDLKHAKNMIWKIHGHIGSKQRNQNVEPKIFFQKRKSHYLAEIWECWVSRRKIVDILWKPSWTKCLWFNTGSTSEHFLCQCLVILQELDNVECPGERVVGI